MKTMLLLETSAGSRWIYVEGRDLVFSPVKADGRFIFLTLVPPQLNIMCFQEVDTLTIDDKVIEFIISNERLRLEVRGEVENYLRFCHEQRVAGTPVDPGKVAEKLARIESKLDKEKEHTLAWELRRRIGTKGLH